MKQGIFAAALATVLVFGFSGGEAKADTPFFISVGGPRGGVSFGSGYGLGYGRGGGGFYHRRVTAYPFGVTTRGLHRGYYRPRGHYHHHHHRVPVRRGYGYGCY